MSIHLSPTRSEPPHDPEIRGVAPVLVVDGVGKAFRRYGNDLARIAAWFGLSSAPVEETWVLRHVDFRIGAGEAVAIVGRNGAGKSTLLKIVTGTMRPTEGRVSLSGRVAAILELGMGFNAELDARTNAYNVGGLMGFSREELDAVMGSIESFAEVGAYFDRPMRLMSSGMQMRVAFAVATAYRPDVLIVDEALSVGDAYFQHKSMDRIRAFRREGTTLVFVSHDAAAVLALCDRAILLEGGRLVLDGPPNEVLDHYNALLGPAESRPSTSVIGSGTGQVSGSREARVVQIGFVDEAGEPLETLVVGRPARLEVRVRVERAIERLVFGFSIRDRLGQTVFGTNTHYSGQSIEGARPGDEYMFRVAFDVMLGPGSYSISTALVSDKDHLDGNYEWRDLALVFEVVNIDKAPFAGGFYLETSMDVRVVQKA